MATFLFAYRRAKDSPVQALSDVDSDLMAAWNAWHDSMGANLVDRGNPSYESTTLGNCGPDTTLGGYSLVTADDLESAVTLAKGCPALERGGGVEVGALTIVES